MYTRTTSRHLHKHITQLIATTILLYSFIYSVQSVACGTTEFCLVGECNTTTTECICPQHYPNCTVQVNSTCTDVDGYCMNGGNCTDVNSGNVTCMCPDGYSGSQCHLTSCDAAVCSGKGQCEQDTITNISTCACEKCYNGTSCDRLVDVSSVQTKHICNLNHSSSKVHCTTGEPKQYCDCDNGFTGSTCFINKNECEGDPCVHGVCVDLIAKYRCDCITGYTGVNCSVDIDECDKGYCSSDNTANCTNAPAGSYTCQCNEGYAGDNCTVPTCTEGLCGANGVCSTNSTDWSCDCNDFYEGRKCEEKGPCVDDPCVHGNCSQSRINGTLEHTCVCEEGWENNSTCNVDINECDMDVCQNEGNCTNNNGSFTCDCTDFWQGDVCEDDVKECQKEGWCQNNGVCTELQGNFSCNCTATGYSGVLCDVNINECALASELCVNGGTCTDTIGSFTCACMPGYTGGTCKTRDYCSDPLYCKTENTVSCVNTPTGANCECKDGFVGVNCAMTDACTSNPCINQGVCTSVNTTSGYDCECSAKFTGATCDIPIEEPVTADPRLAVYIAVPLTILVIAAIIIGAVIFFVMVRKKRATRGRYSPSRHEILGPNLQMSGVLKPPPEERLI